MFTDGMRGLFPQEEEIEILYVLVTQSSRTERAQSANQFESLVGFRIQQMIMQLVYLRPKGLAIGSGGNVPLAAYNRHTQWSLSLDQLQVRNSRIDWPI